MSLHEIRPVEAPVTVVRGADGDAAPVILGMPHTSDRLPPEIVAGLNETGLALADTDWHIDRVFEGLLPGATIVRAGFHRYALDANRAPDDASLYPGQNTTGLCPTTDFDGRPIHRPGASPDAAEIERRRRAYHAPYHAALDAEIARLKARHGGVLLYDCHSIRSEIPFLFAGELPVLNLGTADGASCAPRIEAAAARIAAGSGYSHVLNGRFRGGWTTRRVGRPAEQVHAIQMEIAQRAYLAEERAPWAYHPEKAERLRAVLRAMLTALSAELRALIDEAGR